MADISGEMAYACLENRQEEAQRLWNKGPKTLIALRESFTNACYNGHLSIARWLWGLRTGAGAGLAYEDLRNAPQGFSRPFYYACTHNFPDLAQWLWDLQVPLPGGDLACLTWDDVQADKNSCFNDACADGCLETAKWLWDLHALPSRCAELRGPGLPLTMADVREATPLTYKQSHPLTLLDSRNGFAVLDDDAPRRSAFSRACTNGYLAVSQWLWELIDVEGNSLTLADVQADYNYIFRGVCASGWLDMAQWLVAGSDQPGRRREALSMADVKACRYQAFRLSCAQGHLEVAQWLWSLHDGPQGMLSVNAATGVNEGPNALTMAAVRAWGCEAFHGACQASALDVAQWLWGLRDAAGASLTMADITARQGRTFKLACRYGFTQKIVQWHVAPRLALRDTTGAGFDISVLKDRSCEAFRRVVLNCDLPTAQLLWLQPDASGQRLTIADLRVKENQLFRDVCEHGFLAKAKWLWSLRDATGDGLTLADARARGNAALRKLLQTPDSDYYGVMAKWLQEIGV